MDQIWWNKVPNALAFLTAVSENLAEEKSVLLASKTAVPWKQTLLQSVREVVQQCNSSKRFETVKQVDNPGEFLLSTYCKPEKRAQYRPAKGYPRFFAENDDIVIHTIFYFVEIESLKQLEAWMQFVSEYAQARGKNREKAGFLLQWQGEELPSAKKGIALCSVDEYIGSYDRLVFAMLASSAVQERASIKNYLAELVSNVVGNDIELSAQCIAGYRGFLSDPMTQIRQILLDESRSDGTAYTFELDSEAIKNAVWRTQIKTVYPVLEEYRKDFVEKHKVSISKELPISSSYGEMYTDPKDVELGTLAYMAQRGILSLNPFEKQKLEEYKDARNRLSHLNIMTIDEVRQILV